MMNWRCTLFWGNPYTSPPEGMARTAMAVLSRNAHEVPEEISAKLRNDPEFAPGSGWSIGWACIEQRPIRRWSKDAKSRNRKNRLRKRIEKKFPLFASDFIADELSRRPAYYAGEDVTC